MDQAPPKKIAILGGGVAGLTTAFHLTMEPDWQDKYDITVYQQGWRLGGKCASGHEMKPGYGSRIYEHGLHIFAGWYDHSFRMLTHAYDEIQRPEGHPNQTVWDAFTGHDAIALIDNQNEAEGGKPLIWDVNIPPNSLRPGDDLTQPSLIVMIHKLVESLLHISPGASSDGGLLGAPHKKEGFLASLPHKACAMLKRFIYKVEEEIEEDVLNAVLHAVVEMIDKQVKALHNPAAERDYEISLARFRKYAFGVQAILHGVAEDRVITRGYDWLDQFEWSDWLRRHAIEVGRKFPEWGDPEQRADELVNWTPLRSMYDYAFAFGDGGDVSKPDLGAGTALQGGLLFISYKGHVFWTMRGAMGDVVIAPLYLALKKRGVKFRFFNRVTRLNLAEDRSVVDTIDLVEQVQLREPEKGYEPLIRVPLAGWPANHPLEGWPAEPLWEQLEDGEALRAAGRNFEADHMASPQDQDRPKSLVRGIDFDEIALCISLGGVKQICADFPQQLPQTKWGAMFDKITLTRTCAMQIWFTRTVADLGTDSPGRVVTGADQPYSTWSDMSHLISREAWQGEQRPQSIVYYCGQIPGPENGDAANAKAMREAKSWLRSNATFYWRHAGSGATDYGLDPSIVFDPEPGAPGDALSRQYVRANTNPSDLYVQSPSGSVSARMNASDTGLANLYVAGDWTYCGLNAGCVESAVRSGVRCAAGINPFATLER